MYLFLSLFFCIKTTIVAFGTNIIFMYSLSFPTSTQMFYTVAKTELL